MKALFKLDLKVGTVHNISLDDKCFPVIGGVHPYSTSNSNKVKESDNPLITESALWFKTLALDAIYVDCDRCLIFWTSIQNDVGQDVILRKSQRSKSTANDGFIPEHAKPLFEDFTLFDFDASLKEMMGKCKEVAEKLLKKTYSTAYINSKVANLLHVYILPSIDFSTDDLYALSRTRCLIEERVMRADSEISLKAQGKHLLEVSLDNLKDNLIHSYNFESESYIRSCDANFLKLFLEKVEEDSTVLNLNLEAEQSKVNWAKDHPEEYQAADIKELQKKRNQVHFEVEKLIKVRESLRNVLTRKEKFKPKKSKKTKPEQIESCFHSIFIEINRRWQMDVKMMDQLIVDKVNISGAREATLAAILELETTQRNSERSTRFEPVDFSDCHYDADGKSGKSSNWLTLQERVSQILKDKNSASYKVFRDGCTLITSQIDLTLSEYQLVNANYKQSSLVDKSLSSDFICIEKNDDSASSIQLRENVNTHIKSQEIVNRRSGRVLKGGDRNDLSRLVVQKNLLDSVKSATLSHVSKMDQSQRQPETDPSTQEKRLSLPNLNETLDDEQKQIASLTICANHFSTESSNKNSTKKNSNNDNNCYSNKSFESSYTSIPESVVAITATETETSFLNDSGWINPARGREDEGSAVWKQLALKELTLSIDNLKLSIQEHFRDAINCLQNELDDLGDDTLVVDVYIDRNELIWKAYERYFSERVLPSLAVLYEASLIQSISATYNNISQTSKHELLEGDKILSLFYSGSEMMMDGERVPFAGQRRSDDRMDTYSMARTVSEFSLNILDCSIRDLYALTNADSNDVVKRFNLTEESFELSEEIENPEIAVVVASGSSASCQSNSNSNTTTESGASVKTSDLFGTDDENIDDDVNVNDDNGATATAAVLKLPNNDDENVISVSNLDKSNGDGERFVSSRDTDRQSVSILDLDLESKSSGSDIVSETVNTASAKRATVTYSRTNSNRTAELLDRVLSPFRKQMEKCIRGKCILDKVRYLSKAIEGLNTDVSKLYGGDHQSVCDDIITMLIFALSHMPQDIFVRLYINLKLLIDILPRFLTGSLCEYNIVSLVASYDYLNNRNASQQVIHRRDSADFGNK